LLSMDKIDFVDWLKKELEKRDWSQADLARLSKISPTQIGRILLRERNAGTDALIAIADALNLPPEEVLRAAGVLPPKSERTEKIEKIHHIFDQLPPEEQDKLIEYAQFVRRQAERTRAKKMCNNYGVAIK